MKQQDYFAAVSFKLKVAFWGQQVQSVYCIIFTDVYFMTSSVSQTVEDER